MLYIITGTNTISELLTQSHSISEHALFIPMMIMLLIGAFTKSAHFHSIFGYLKPWLHQPL